MFARLTNFLSKNTREETQPLLPTKNAPTSRDAFDKVPNEMVMNIASYLTPKDMANLAQTNKRMHSLVETIPTAFEVHQLVGGEVHVSKNATYAQLRKAFNERAVIERQITKKQPGKLVKSLREHRNGVGATCFLASVSTCATAVGVGGPLISNPFIVASMALGSSVGLTVCLPICLVSSQNYFERHQVRRDEKIQALKEELKTKPQIMAMRK